MLVHALRLIEDKDHWCQCAVAKNSHGEITSPTDPLAVQWCAIGACVRANVDWSDYRLLDQASKDLFGQFDIIAVNNELGHEATIRCFMEAINAKGS